MGYANAQARQRELNKERPAIEADEDPRIAWGRVRGEIDGLLRSGRDVPAELRHKERALMVELVAQSQGR
ncbi:MAG TPA: hypothetical protein PK264_22825 [Hyphomicrobiaceae bacterium]|nr:hypothetical protein [Hyphomicrobiaceae bacterium]